MVKNIEGIARDDLNKDETSSNKDANASNQKKNNLGKASIKDRFEVNFDEPIEWLDTNGAKAYNVVDNINKHKKLFGLVCNGETYARNSFIQKYKNISNPNMITLVENYIVLDPLTNKENVILIYEQPLGGKIIENNKDLLKFKKNEPEINSLLSKLLSILETLRRENLTHRSIRIDNLFYKDEERTEIIIGDCLASFPAFHQPAIYETIESLFAVREGRGEGSIKDDIYSAAATLLLLHEGIDHIDNNIEDDAKILKKKLKNGSFLTICGTKSHWDNTSKILYYMLDDDADERLNTINIYEALSDKHFTKANISRSENSKKAIIINDKKIYSLKDLSYTMYLNTKEAYEIIKNEKILDWIKNALEDNELHSKVDQAIKVSENRNENWETLTAKVIAILYPKPPLNYKELAIFPDAISKCLFYAKNKQMMNSFNIMNEIISNELFRTWYQEKKDIRSAIHPQDFKLYADNIKSGYGLFRIIFAMDEDAPCNSRILNGKYISSPKRVLQAIESYNENGDKNDESLIDKQLIAYLYTKLGKNIDDIIQKINSINEETQNLAFIKLFALMQIKYGPAKLPALSKWMAYISSPIIKSYHNIKYRKFLEKEIIKVLPQGNISLIYGILGDENAKKKDVYNYHVSMNEATKLIGKKNHITHNSKSIEFDSIKLGQNFTSVIAIITMLISFLYNIIKWVMN